MAKTRLLVQNFRRLSTPDVCRRTSKGDVQHLEAVGEDENAKLRSKSSPDILQSDAKPTILSLPIELLAQIAVELSFPDLCSIRSICHDAHDLISEGEIVRTWIARSTSRDQLNLYPPPKPPTFMYLVAQQRRSHVASNMSGLYAEYVEQEILRYTLRRQHHMMTATQYREGFQHIRGMICERMIPVVSIIQHYLENLSIVILRRLATEMTDDSFNATLAIEERRIFDAYSPEQILGAHKFFMFLTWVNNQLLNRPSYAGVFERAVRGWMVDPLQHSYLRLIMVLCNLSSIGRLMHLKSFKERRKAVESEIRRLDPESNVSWQRSWTETGLEYERSLSTEQASAALKIKLEAGDVWVNGARAILIEKGLMNADEETEIGTPQQCTEFLCDLAGYDVLHTLPPSEQSG